MYRRNQAALFIAMAALLVPLAASAQDPPPPPPPPLPQPQQPPLEVQQWLQEMQQLQAELEPIQTQALQDTALQREQEEVGVAVRDAMVAADPANAERLDRFEKIMMEARAAQEAGDADKIAELTSEAAELQPQVEAAQAEALAQPEVEARLASFEGNLKARMIEIDPNAKQQIDRLEELNRLLQEAMGRTG